MSSTKVAKSDDISTTCCSCCCGRRKCKCGTVDRGLIVTDTNHLLLLLLVSHNVALPELSQSSLSWSSFRLRLWSVELINIFRRTSQICLALVWLSRCSLSFDLLIPRTTTTDSKNIWQTTSSRPDGAACDRMMRRTKQKPPGGCSNVLLAPILSAVEVCGTTTTWMLFVLATTIGRCS